MELHERRTLFRRLADDPVAAAAAALLGAATAGLLVYALLEFSDAGDEPPIRVRHGTVILEVVHNRYKWTGPAGGPWKLTGGTRGSDILQVYLAPTDPAHCGNVQKGSSDVVRLTISNDPNKWIQLASVGQHLQVTANGVTGTLENRGKWLKFGDDGDFVSGVTIGVTTGGNPTCTFPAKDTGLHVMVTE